MVSRIFHNIYFLLITLLSNAESLPLLKVGAEHSGEQINTVYLTNAVIDEKDKKFSENMLLFESDSNFSIEPSNYPQIAIKIETQFGPGMKTSKTLVKRVINWLLQKGYKKNSLLLFDRDRTGLVASGFLLDESKEENFFGVQVLHSGTKGFFNNSWFHDSPLPPTHFDRSRLKLMYKENVSLRIEEERKSYLPFPHLQGVFWINLAVPMDDPFLGIDGASSNITLGSISNYGRFSRNKTLSAAAVTEILAIPEIWEKKLFSILDFSQYQVANGQRFDSRYVGKQNAMFIGRNPLALDYYAMKILNKERKVKHNLHERSTDEALLFKYAEELGLAKKSEFSAKKLN